MIINKYNRKFINLLIKTLSPVKARHQELSLLMSLEDSPLKLSNRLLDISSQILKEVEDISLNDISQRTEETKKYTNVWPGEHYKLLAAIAKILKPKLVVEVGTATGLSALAIKKYLNESGKIVTFDVVKWQDYPNVCLRESDFSDGRLKQEIDDLSDQKIVLKHRGLLEEADLVFLDAEKDGVMEEKFLTNFEQIEFKNDPIFILDDVRLWNMLKIWRQIKKPKLDISSFGHWSGTGLIDWNK